MGEAPVNALIAGASVLIEDGRVAVDIDCLRVRHPHLVVVSITPYGRRGPYGIDRPATEFTVQAEAGSLLARGRPSREPVQIGGRIGEFVAGSYAAPAVIASTMRARRSGIGEHIDVSIAECMVIAATLFGDLAHHLNGRRPLTRPFRNLETPSIERCKDGWVGFNTNTGQMFQNFLLLIERPDLLDDTELATFQGRVAHGDEWQAMLDEYFAQHEVAEIVERAAELRIPVAPVCNGETILTNDHLAERGVFVTNPAGFVQPRPPYLINGTSVRDFQPAPRLGQHTGSVWWPPVTGADRSDGPAEPAGPPTRRAQGARPDLVVGRALVDAVPGRHGRRGDPPGVDLAPRWHAHDRLHLRPPRLVGVERHVCWPSTPTSWASRSICRPSRVGACAPT